MAGTVTLRLADAVDSLYRHACAQVGHHYPLLPQPLLRRCRGPFTCHDACTPNTIPGVCRGCGHFRMTFRQSLGELLLYMTGVKAAQLDPESNDMQDG